MRLELLLATMNQENDNLLETMKIQSDVLVCNQNKERTTYREYDRNGYKVKWYDFQEKGVGLNRNNALLRATSDICLLADDDVVYEEGYQEIVLNAFLQNPKADVILFNIHSDRINRFNIKRKMRIHIYNCGKFGAVRIAFRRAKVIKNAIAFNTLFGGGCQFNAGEDVIFIKDCLKNKLKVIAVPDYILTLTEERESTWFKGYDEKYFEDLGSSYCYLYGKLAKFCAFLQLIKGRKRFGDTYSFKEKFRLMKNGIKKYKDL